MSTIASELARARWRVSIIPGISAEIALPGTPDYEEAQRLQAARFAPTVHVEPGAGAAYMAVTDYAPDLTIPVVVRSDILLPQLGTSLPPRSLLGTARLELAGATLVEATMRLRPGSVSAEALARRHTTEIGGFATPTALERATLLDVIDTLAAAFLEIARTAGLDWFWWFPRIGFMPLMWATIPGVLPPYRVRLAPDVLGWNEGNERLTALRALQPRGMQDFPELYHLSRATFREDLERRLAWRPRRVRVAAQMDALLFHAMRAASRLLPQHAHTTALAEAGPTWREGPMPPPEPAEAWSNRGAGNDRDFPTTSTSSTISTTPSTAPSPFAGAVSETAAEYSAHLQAMLQVGGAAMTAYKETSFQLLALEPGMSVLEIGCGSGLDLPTLAVRVGATGRVVGLERNPELVRMARAHLEHTAATSDGARAATCMVFQGDGEQLTFPAGIFDRVRVDRALQHIAHPERALQEMWRVLRPDGIACMSEPDWKAVVLWPSSGAANPDPDDDTTLQRVLTWLHQQLQHGLIGRRLPGLLRGMDPVAWSQVAVTVHAFTLTDWRTADAILQLTDAAQALAQEQPALRQEVERWLERVQAADRAGTFFATVPLFYATACKAAEQSTAGVSHDHSRSQHDCKRSRWPRW